MEVTDLNINLPFGHSAIVYESPNFNIVDLRRELVPTQTYGFILYQTESFDTKENCETDTYNVRSSVNDQPINVQNECILGYPNPIDKNKILDGGNRWYLSSQNPSINRT